MANHNQRFMYCDDCAKVVRVDLPECVHFGAIKVSKHVESTTVVFRSSSGKISIPWDDKTPCPKGYVREEIRGARAVRRLEQELDAKDLQRHRNWQEKRQLLFRHDERREDLKQIISQGVTTKVDADGTRRTIHVSQFGRDLARQALRRIDSAPPERYDPGNYRES